MFFSLLAQAQEVVPPLRDLHSSNGLRMHSYDGWSSRYWRNRRSCRGKTFNTLRDSQPHFITVDTKQHHNIDIESYIHFIPENLTFEEWISLTENGLATIEASLAVLILPSEQEIAIFEAHGQERGLTLLDYRRSFQVTENGDVFSRTTYFYICD